MNHAIATILLLFATSCSRAIAGDAENLIHWLLTEERDLKGVPFSEVVQASASKRIIPIDPAQETDRLLLRKIGEALDRVLTRLNAPDSAAQKEQRINEVSAHFEAAVKAEMNRVPGFACDFAKTAAGRVQRSGYPDLRLVDSTSKRVVYLDPKLHEQSGRESSLRTFYFEPKNETGKIHDDAHHLAIGIEHDGRKSGTWKFLRWELVDLSRLHVRLKAEFQASNRDLYRPEAIVGRSGETAGSK